MVGCSLQANLLLEFVPNLFQDRAQIPSWKVKILTIEEYDYITFMLTILRIECYGAIYFIAMTQLPRWIANERIRLHMRTHAHLSSVSRYLDKYYCAVFFSIILMVGCIINSEIYYCMTRKEKRPLYRLRKYYLFRYVLDRNGNLSNGLGNDDSCQRGRSNKNTLWFETNQTHHPA